MTENEHVERLVDALIECTGPIAQIVDHMVQAPDPMPPEDGLTVLRMLLGDALAPLAQEAEPAALRTATKLVHDAARLIAEEIFLVPHRPRRSRARRRRGGH
jgi:hypothetical protein